MVEAAWGDFSKDSAVLLFDDLVDSLAEIGIVKDAGVVSPSWRDDLSGSIDDGFHIVRPHPLVLSLDVEFHSCLRDFRVESRQFSLILPDDSTLKFGWDSFFLMRCFFFSFH